MRFLTPLFLIFILTVQLVFGEVWEFGENDLSNIIVYRHRGDLSLLEKTKTIQISAPECFEIAYVKVQVNNIVSTPAVQYDNKAHEVTITYTPLQISISTYDVVASGKMKPSCYEPAKNRYFNPARFVLLSKEFYACWCNHQKELQMAKHKVDDSPPELFPELYLKPRRLDYYARQLEETMNVNKELLKRINLIQRTGGYVDCWMPEPNNQYNKLLCQQRQRNLNEIQKANFYFYTRLLIARSEQLLTKELDAAWKDTKHKLILGASLPFILFKTGKIDRDIKDPAFDKPPTVNRTKVSMDIWVKGGSKIGKVLIELFTDIVPNTCQLFLSLVKGDSMGHAYTGTRFFRIVPDLYCTGGDVTKDNGFGCYAPNGEASEPMGGESFTLNHTVPGVLSMVVSSDEEVCGQFNIIFKPLPQFDKKHVVFGRIVAGPAPTLERISALGLPLGTTSTDCIIRSCGWFTRTGQYREGSPNTIKFPPRRKAKR